MDKRFIIIAIFIFVMISNFVTAQGIFNQKGSQLKRLAEQVAALQAYMGVLNKGYKIAKEGLKTINDFKSGEYNLHNIFFTSLKTVNPKIKKYVKVAEIITIQVELLNNCKKTYEQVKSSHQFAVNEEVYIGQVFDKVISDCEAAIDDLIALTTDSSLEMKDDERIEHIDQIYLDMQDMNVFCKSFSSETLVLGASRMDEETQVKSLKNWIGVQK
ncbi:hypothetical protein [Pedobacter sp.]|jgi:hypothetical protein|uniref:hypothetical protein n=1 Tax=Pedobacter sp. TaxID=1411316 RepID=UPI002BA4082D|nr:hypothetical protein [Pedobacter sp.]HWW41919.1 hypothetical protein [Pedobacter sp.]